MAFVPPAHDGPIREQGHAVVFAGGDRDRIGDPGDPNRHLAARGGVTGFRPFGAAQPELSKLVFAPGEDRAVRQQGETVVAAGGHGYRARDTRDQGRNRVERGGAVAEFPVVVVAPRHHPAACEQREAEFIAAGEFGRFGDAEHRRRHREAGAGRS
jgi:hypothetical protein